MVGIEVGELEGFVNNTAVGGTDVGEAEVRGTADGLADDTNDGKIVGIVVGTVEGLLVIGLDVGIELKGCDTGAADGPRLKLIPDASHAWVVEQQGFKRL